MSSFFWYLFPAPPCQRSSVNVLYLSTLDPRELHLQIFLCVCSQLVNKGFRMKKRGLIEVKGKGLLTTYFLVGDGHINVTEPEDKFMSFPVLTNDEQETTEPVASYVTKLSEEGSIDSGHCLDSQEKRKHVRSQHEAPDRRAMPISPRVVKPNYTFLSSASNQVQPTSTEKVRSSYCSVLWPVAFDVCSLCSVSWAGAFHRLPADCFRDCREDEGKTASTLLSYKPRKITIAHVTLMTCYPSCTICYCCRDMIHAVVFAMSCWWQDTCYQWRWRWRWRWWKLTSRLRSKRRATHYLYIFDNIAIW